MGCDIHIIAEVKENGVWRENTDAVFLNPDYEPRSTSEWAKDKFTVNPHDGRNYVWFSILAGVRNRNFLNPISEPKGFPPDQSKSAQIMEEDWGCDLHSLSYLTHAEFREYDWGQVVLVSKALELKEWTELYTNNKIDYSSFPKISNRIASTIAIKESVALELSNRIESIQELEDTDRLLLHDLGIDIKLDEKGEISELSETGTDYKELRIVVPCDTEVRYDEVVKYPISHTVEPLQELGKKYEDARIVFGFDN